MNAITILCAALALLKPLLCECVSAEPDLHKLVLEQGVSFEESYNILHRLNNNVARRFKRQQVINIPKSILEADTVDQPTECGINGKSLKRIKFENRVASSRAPAGTDWPWMVVLLQTNYLEHFCGGVLLNRNYVLTAAHCVQGKIPEGIRVRIGEYDFLSSNETDSKDFEIAEIKVHKDYDAATQRHDIALIRLRKNVMYGTNVRPVCLPTIQIAKPNNTAVVAGWGTIFYGGPFSEVLLEVAVSVWDLSNCISKYTQPVFNTNMCAAGYEGGKDACSGDSGGPLLMQEPSGRWVNVGIVSWGIGCGGKNQPGVYTSVNSYLRWIKRKMRDAVL